MRSCLFTYTYIYIYIYLVLQLLVLLFLLLPLPLLLLPIFSPILTYNINDRNNINICFDICKRTPISFLLRHIYTYIRRTHAYMDLCKICQDVRSSKFASYFVFFFLLFFHHLLLLLSFFSCSFFRERKEKKTSTYTYTR